MIEPKAGVFVGTIPPPVRERLWDKAVKGARDGACVMVYAANTEQRYAVRTWGVARRALVDFDGLSLVRLPSFRPIS